ncbi:unnamed protein product [Effrenium voratum]|uniref:Uncharacterized protein n=1 Tax=Effrenium voratum TaxID=2562239 RepID=A0AA36J0S0_9DINO|nr:unnamed protein product [Effrenium voratum]
MSMPWLRCTALALLSRCDIAVSVEQIDDESCPVQLLQVSQALDGPGPWEAIRDLVREAGRAESAAVLAPATVADGAAEDARKALQSAGAENFLQDLGRAEQAALAEPSRVPAKTVESALPGFEKPAMVQQSAQTQTGAATETICIIVGAVLLAFIVCLIFSCFKPSTSYEEEPLKGDGQAAATLQRPGRTAKQDCC